jgi:hypothetical protein
MKKITIKSAEYLEGYKIKFCFSNKKKTIVDFRPFITAKNQNPMVAKYQDIGRFREFEIIDDMDISWNNFEMCFQFKTIYKGGQVLPIDRNKLKKSVIKYFGKKEAEKMFAEVEMV